MSIAADEWLGLMRTEYLDAFVRDGGSAVKVLVHADADSVDRVRRRLHGDAVQRGYRVLAVDATTTRVHLLEQVFFAIARQVDWIELARARLERVLGRDFYELPRGEARFSYDAIARLNQVDASLVEQRAERALTRDVLHDRGLAAEFRIAMSQLLLREMQRDPSAPRASEPLIEWLRGELRAISVLKKLRIFRRITRHGARAMLASLIRFLRATGTAGVLLDVDIRRCFVPRNQGGDGFRYGPSATLDLYEVLRQLIDGTDQMAGALIVVHAPPEFVDETSNRGIGRYQALRMRLWDEVRDRTRDNPLAPLVSLANGGAA